jgi:hypothetical protein
MICMPKTPSQNSGKSRQVSGSSPKGLTHPKRSRTGRFRQSSSRRRPYRSPGKHQKKLEPYLRDVVAICASTLGSAALITLLGGPPQLAWSLILFLGILSPLLIAFKDRRFPRLVLYGVVSIITVVAISFLISVLNFTPTAVLELFTRITPRVLR